MALQPFPKECGNHVARWVIWLVCEKVGLIVKWGCALGLDILTVSSSRQILSYFLPCNLESNKGEHPKKSNSDCPSNYFSMFVPLSPFPLMFLTLNMGASKPFICHILEAGLRPFLLIFWKLFLLPKSKKFSEIKLQWSRKKKKYG